ncbi:uncharacterized protein LOC108152905 [Drosophila miranda]|uniref:uncharacterized protein LOC108152905 n=1 Tax=Drosophila miranda TaxID=7229 RepID=UPI0007E5C88E|nr:uncharacterized protein LOC108152905 [Drosophila miranda]XP_017138041.1 uncharacterized protein LOC108152905 [Drosophila miranda]
MKVMCYIFEFLSVVQLLVETQSGHVQEAKRSINAEIRDALGHHRSYHGSHWIDGKRVHRMRMPHQRWSGRRRSINHHQPFSRWTQWTPCDEECVKRRERYCKAKRRCGHTKHVEQSKCRRCHPAPHPPMKWHQTITREPVHIQQEHHSQPSIIINAAAAASSGPSSTYATAHPPEPPTSYWPPSPPHESVEVVHRVPSHRPKVVYSEEEEEQEQEQESDDSGYSGERGDFFVLKHNRHRRRQRPRKRPQRIKKPSYSYEDDDFDDYLQPKSLRPRNMIVDSSSGLEGDIFQYEDFDLEQENLEPESEEYLDFRNDSWPQSPKERYTPDGLIPRRRRIYSKWSRWSRCTPKCTTRRYKKCRINEQCGREVLREIAYCYTEGSFCQQWLQTQFQKTPAYETRPGPGSAPAMQRRQSDAAMNRLTNNELGVIMTSKGYRGPEYTPIKLHCGIARSGSGRRNMNNMLKIIGGKAARKGEWPWQVAILNRFKEAFCGGTLVAPSWVLTAAHCVRKVLYVRLGEHNLDYEDGSEVQLRVLKSFKHPNFDRRTVDSDVALLRLPKPANATTWIGYSCLPRPFQALPKNVDCTVIGWGKRRNHDAAGTSVLHKANVPIIPMDNCRNVYHDYTITKNMFCAGHRRGLIDTCAGDSGGPLLCRDTTKPNHPWTIFGITSFGDGCAKRNKFGIYARVPNYVDWVWSVVNCNGNCKMQ